jgi:protein-S-isoprenylcysteine O-methyltransferase Ste14
MPKVGAPLFLLASVALFFVIPALAWGSVSDLLAHPARVVAHVVVIIGTVAFFFGGTSLASFTWDDPRSRAVMLVALPVTALFLSLPAYADRHDIGAFDGDYVRYTGLALYAIGCWLRIGPMFALRKRFRAPWTEQEEHCLARHQCPGFRPTNTGSGASALFRSASFS